MRRLLVLSLAIGLLVVSGSDATGQAASVESGWWTTAPAAVAPDASEENLLVQGGPSADDPLAFAAVSYAGPSGATPETMELKVAPEDRVDAVHDAGRLSLTTSTFSPAEGGSADEAPEYDCAKKVTAAAEGDGGAIYTFDVAALAEGADLAVAIVPTVATDRVVLERPDEGSFVVTSGSVTRVPGATGATVPPATADDTVSSPAGGSFASTDPAATSGDVSLPATSGDDPAVATPSEQPKDPAASNGTEAAGGDVALAAPASATTSTSGWARFRGALFVVLALAAAGLWLAAGSEDRTLMPVGDEGGAST